MKMIGLQIAALLMFLLMLCLPASSYTFSYDFESGQDWTTLGSSIPGIVFGTANGGDLYYADINNTVWLFASNNDKVNDDWEYWISENIGIISPDDNIACLSFTNSIASFSIGYSSYYPFIVEAYDRAGNLVDSQTGERNSGSWSGTGLSYLSVSGTGISSVRFYADQGSYPAPGYWVADNMAVETSAIPEANSIMLAISGIGSIFGLIRLKER